MILNKQWASDIMGEVRSLTQEQLILVDDSGHIIASTDEDRIGTFHEGAVTVIQTGEKLHITKEMAQQLRGVKPGINLPIFYENRLMGVIGITGPPQEVEPFAKLIQRMAELIICETTLLEKKDWSMRTFESFFNEWVNAKSLTRALQDKGERLGISFDAHYQCQLCQIATADLIKKDAEDIEQTVFQWFNDIIPQSDYLIRWGLGTFLYIRTVYHGQRQSLKDKEQMANWRQMMIERFHHEIAIGVGRVVPAVKLYLSYQEAKLALQEALPSWDIVHYDSLLLELIINEVPQQIQRQYIERVFANIASDRTLLLTIKTYLQKNMSLKETAKALHIHVNTLHYRLNDVKKRTSIDLRSSLGITLFNLAFSLQDRM